MTRPSRLNISHTNLLRHTGDDNNAKKGRKRNQQPPLTFPPPGSCGAPSEYAINKPSRDEMSGDLEIHHGKEHQKEQFFMFIRSFAQHRRRALLIFVLLTLISDVS